MELHLFILWERARNKEQEILADIKKHLKIIECFDIGWNKKLVADNFSRFYGVKLPDNSAKEKECGNGRFLLVTVADENPHYEFVETSRGHEYVNTNIFNLKEKYRKLTGGGHKIHATNNSKETNHDIVLLLGKNYEDYLRQAPKEWNGESKKLERDLSGSCGWKNLEELFYVLNSTANYVVLRGIENMQNFSLSREHQDIDIFTDEYSNLVFLINGIPQVNKQRPHFLTKIGGQQIYLDVWSAGKGYYDESWESNILQNRVLSGGFYALSREDAFYELIYHTIIHKSKIAEDYVAKADTLFRQLELWPKIEVVKYPYVFDVYYQLLKHFMFEHHYNFVKPEDTSVYYNSAIVHSDKIISYLERNYALSEVEPIMINHYTGSGYIYFQGYYGKQKLFIKWGGVGDTCKNEFVYTQRFHKISADHFIKPVFYKYDGDKKFMAMDYVNGVSLERIMNEEVLSQLERDNLVIQLGDIAKTLFNSKCVHRDVRPANFILTDNNQLKLIDNQFVADSGKYRECRTIRKNPYMIDKLGDKYAYAQFMWDDIYSICKIIEDIGIYRCYF